jgi:hypothetical protein
MAKAPCSPSFQVMEEEPGAHQPHHLTGVDRERQEARHRYHEKKQQTREQRSILPQRPGRGDQ